MIIPDFKRVLRGYDPEAVEQAWEDTDRQLSEANAANKELRLQINSLREQNSEWGNRLKSYEQIEKDLRDALISAQRIASQLEEEAAKQAKELLQSAHIESETLLSEATRISESKGIETETMLIEKREEIIRVGEQIQGLVEERTRLLTQVDRVAGHIEMIKEILGPSTNAIELEKDIDF